MSYHQPVLPRSAGSIPVRRIPQSWPPDRDFRILSIDGGGIRGIFPAAVLADLEAALGTSNSIVGHFDLVAGTSSGPAMPRSTERLVGCGLIRRPNRCSIAVRFRTPSPDSQFGN